MSSRGTTSSPSRSSVLTVIDTINRDDEGQVHYHYTLVAYAAADDQAKARRNDADEVAWLNRAEIIEGGIPTAPRCYR